MCVERCLSCKCVHAQYVVLYVSNYLDCSLPPCIFLIYFSSSALNGALQVSPFSSSPSLFPAFTYLQWGRLCVRVCVCVSFSMPASVHVHKNNVKLYIKRLISSLDVVIWSVCVCACVRALLLPVYQWGHISTDDLGWRANLAGSGSRCSPQHFHTTRQAGKWSSPVSVREQRKTVKPRL